MINRLVVNGCSYMDYYAEGNGHVDLAQNLGISKANSLAVHGSCNSRIIRTTLKDCFATTEPTFYVVSTTFLNRYEIPVTSGRPIFDGKWHSFSGANTAMPNAKFDSHFNEKDLSTFAELYDKFTVLGLPDLAENLMYSILSMIHTLHHRGHKILLFNTAEHTVEYFINDTSFDLFRQQKEVVGGFEWRSIPYQISKGAAYLQQDWKIPENCRHIAPGQHRWLNEFLTSYIKEHNIL